MFEIFDQIKFYVISEEELDLAREEGRGDELVKIEEAELDLVGYERLVGECELERRGMVERRMLAIKETGFMEEMTKSYRSDPALDSDSDLGDKGIVGEVVKSEVAGRCWNCAVSEGDEVQAGQELVCRSNFTYPVFHEYYLHKYRFASKP